MAQKAPKLAFLIPNLQPGGMERVMSELLQYFSKNTRCELHLVMYGIQGKIFYKIPHNILIHQPTFKFDNNKRLWHTVKTFFFLRKTIKQINPHSILSFGEYWNNFVLIALLGLKFPIYVSDRSQPDKSLGKLHDFLRAKLYPKASGVICQTEKAQKIYASMFQHANFKIIGNPIKNVNSAITEKQNIVLSVGRLIDTKHFDELIEIFSSININNWKLVIVGDNALKQDNKSILQKLIQDLGKEDTIILAGRQSDVDSYYSRSKIFAFTSSSEGFPNVIGEAMSAGLPVVAYDCTAGPSDLISHGETGFLIKLHDKKDFTSKLQQLMQDENLRETMGANGKEKIMDNSLKVIGSKFKKVILENLE